MHERIERDVAEQQAWERTTFGDPPIPDEVYRRLFDRLQHLSVDAPPAGFAQRVAARAAQASQATGPSGWTVAAMGIAVGALVAFVASRLPGVSLGAAYASWAPWLASIPWPLLAGVAVACGVVHLVAIHDAARRGG